MLRIDKDRGVIDMQAPLDHHLLQISVAERIPQVPPDTEQNDLGLEVAPFERAGGVNEIGSSRFSEYRRVYLIFDIFATQLLQKGTLIFGLSCEHKPTSSHVILVAHPSATSEVSLYST